MLFDANRRFRVPGRSIAVALLLVSLGRGRGRVQEGAPGGADADQPDAAQPGAGAAANAGSGFRCRSPTRCRTRSPIPTRIRTRPRRFRSSHTGLLRARSARLRLSRATRTGQIGTASLDDFVVATPTGKRWSTACSARTASAIRSAGTCHQAWSPDAPWSVDRHPEGAERPEPGEHRQRPLAERRAHRGHHRDWRRAELRREAAVGVADVDVEDRAAAPSHPTAARGEEEQAALVVRRHGDRHQLVVAGHGDLGSRPALHRVGEPGPRSGAERARGHHGDPLVPGVADRVLEQDLRPAARQRQRLVERQHVELHRLRHHPRVGAPDAVDVAADLGVLGAERGREDHRGGVGAAAAERGDLALPADPLEAGDDRDLSPLEHLAEPIGPDLDHPGIGVGLVGDDARLGPGERTAGTPRSRGTSRAAPSSPARRPRSACRARAGRAWVAMSRARARSSSVVLPIADTTTHTAGSRRRGRRRSGRRRPGSDPDRRPTTPVLLDDDRIQPASAPVLDPCSPVSRSQRVNCCLSAARAMDSTRPDSVLNRTRARRGLRDQALPEPTELVHVCQHLLQRLRDGAGPREPGDNSVDLAGLRCSYLRGDLRPAGRPRGSDDEPVHRVRRPAGLDRRRARLRSGARR